MSDRIAQQIVQQHYGPSREDRMEEVRSRIQAIMDDPNWCTASGERAMVPKELLTQLLANDPDA